jgi:hypothetical protein
VLSRNVHHDHHECCSSGHESSLISKTPPLIYLWCTVRLRRSVVRMCLVILNDFGHELALLMVMYHVGMREVQSSTTPFATAYRYDGIIRRKELTDCCASFGFRLTHTYPQNHAKVEALSVGPTLKACAETKSPSTRNPYHRILAPASTLHNPPVPNAHRRRCRREPRRKLSCRLPSHPLEDPPKRPSSAARR